MKGVQVDIKKATIALNECRIGYTGAQFSRDNIIGLLASKLEVSKSTIESKYLKGLVKFGILSEQWKDGHKVYTFADLNQYHRDRVENALLRSHKKDHNGMDREKCIEYLKSLGYKILAQGKFNPEKAKSILGDRTKECYDYEEI